MEISNISDQTKGWIARLFLGLGMVIASGVLVVGQALLAVDSEQVGYEPPPEYVSIRLNTFTDRFKFRLPSDFDTTTNVEEEEKITVTEEVTPPLDTPRRSDYPELARAVMAGDEHSATSNRLLRSEDLETRLEVTYALVEAAVITGVDDRTRYWESLGNDGREVARVTLREAMVDTAEQNKSNPLPFFLRQTAVPGDSTGELLAWVSRHHSQDSMRMNAMRHVVFMAPRSDLASQVISERAHDSSLDVRIEVLKIRMGRALDF